MSLPSCSALVEELPGLPHAERVRLLVRTAREHDDEAGLAPLLDELTAASTYHAGLVVEAARAIGDTARLKALTRHPGAVVRIRALAALPLDAQSPDELAVAYLAMPLQERRRLEARLGRAHRTDLIDALLDLPLSDADRARLLPRAGRERIEALLPDLADLLVQEGGRADEDEGHEGHEDDRQGHGAVGPQPLEGLGADESESHFRPPS